jgi:hypothetical protein
MPIMPSGMPGPWENSFREQSEGSDVEVQEVTEDPRSDLSGLLQHLGALQQNGIQLVEAVFIGNMWTWRSIIPFQHWGYVLKTSSGEYITLDFTRNGILWDIYPEFPPYPQDTFSVTRFKITKGASTQLTKDYCQESPPFQFMFYDCKTWCDGLMVLLQMEVMEKILDSNPRREFNTPFCT